ncbi:HAD-IC family P-type ATPase [Candidatus Kuenenbacteria bacterium]|nr:HAD-IC family P-type ATPase [Candidatus Kuenenbacteria bacterium]
MSQLSQSIYQAQQRRDHKKWYVLTQEDLFQKLETGKNGLSDEEVKKRLAKHGANKMPEGKKISKGALLLRQFNSSLVYVLLGATAISIMLGDYIDAGVILLAVLINVALGYYQENKAISSLGALRKVAINYCKVYREGKEKQIMADELVRGDLVFLSAGDRVPADLRILKTSNLKINEAPLTGESNEIEKTSRPLAGELILADQANMAFLGTQITQGNGLAIVVATGQETELGKIAGLVANTEDPLTPLQKKLASFARKLSSAAVGGCFLIFIAGLILGYDAKQIFVTAVAISVAIIPEGLLIVMTVILAFGMQRILKEKALTKQLLAAETLGSTTVICTDKTGTITDGEMRVVEVATLDYNFNLFDGQTKKDEQGGNELIKLLKIGVLCNNAYIENPEVGLEHRIVRGSPTEKALLMVGANVGLEKNKLEKEEPRLAENPFDSAWKFMLTLHKGKEENWAYLKGAPEVVLSLSKYIYSDEKRGEIEISQKEQERLLTIHEEMSKKGLRVLALAYKKISSKIKTLEGWEQKDFVFVGLAGIKDPLRSEAPKTIREVREAGIQTVIITGDHELTARTIAKELGMPAEAKNIMNGERLAKITESELLAVVPKISIYARVAPEDKLKIVKAWQDRGEVVAMTGDGINDAPALKKANIGIAVNSGTDVAKETADIVLLDNNFATIAKAVREGRVIYDNIKKVVFYFLSDGLAEVITVGVGMLLGWPLPLLASQIIWINLIDDTFPGIAIAKEPAESNIMKQRPRKLSEPILNRESFVLIGAISILSAAGTLFFFRFFWQQTGDINLGRTVGFTFLAINTLIYIFSARNFYRPIWQTNIFNNKSLLLAVMVGLAMQAFAVYNGLAQKVFQTVALGWEAWLAIMLGCILIIAMVEAIKLFYSRKNV